MNMVAFSGYLATDPEPRTTQDGTPVVTFRVAGRKKYSKDKDASIFFNVQAWRNQADFVVKYFSKGKPIEIEGYLDTHPWTDKNGSKHEGIRIVADRIGFSLGDKPKEQDGAKASAPSAVPDQPEGFDPFGAAYDDSGDLPF